MKKHILFQLIFLAVFTSAAAQSDSLTVIHATARSTRITRGVTLKEFIFTGNLFASNQHISILEVKNRRKLRFNLAYEEHLLRNTSDYGSAAHALPALNGSFFDVKNGGSVDYIRSDGRMIAENKLGKNGSRALHQQSAIVINKGKITLPVWDGSTNWEKTLEGEDVLLTGPMLISNKAQLILDTTAFVRLRHPRTAIALVKNKTLFITVDGRNDNAAGMNLHELASFLYWLHASQAINLDGGGSTTLWVNGKDRQGIVNHPSDNKKWDNEGERKVANAILLEKH